MVRWQFGIAMIGFCTVAMAQHSYQDAQRLLFNNSPAIMAAQSLTQANHLQNEALKHLGLPSVNLRVQAISYHQHADISLAQLKQSTKQHFVQQAEQQMSQLGNTLHLAPAALDAIFIQYLHNN